MRNGMPAATICQPVLADPPAYAASSAKTEKRPVSAIVEESQLTGRTARHQ